MFTAGLIAGAVMSAGSAMCVASMARNPYKKAIQSALMAAGNKRKVGSNELPPIIKRSKQTSYGFRLHIALPPGKSSHDAAKVRQAIREAIRKDVDVSYDHSNGVYVDVYTRSLPDKITVNLNDNITRDLRVPIGINRRENVVYFDFASKFPHLLIAGASGGGKSVCLRGILVALSLKPEPPALYLSDLKGGVELAPYATLGHCEGFADTIGGTAAMLADIENEMNKRLQIMRGNGTQQWRGRAIVFVMDEMVDLLGIPGEDKDAKAVRVAAKASLAQISAKGRAAGVYLVLCTQRPDAKVIDGIIKTNVASRIGFRATDEVQSGIIIDRPDLARLPDVPGRALFRQSGLTEIQTFFLSHEDAMKYLEKVKRRSSPNEYRDDNTMDDDLTDVEDLGLFDD